MRTDMDYADMVNPHVRAEAEAENRGWWKGFRDAAFSLLVGFTLGIALINVLS